MEKDFLQLKIPFFSEILERMESMEKKLEQIAKQSPLEETWLDNQEVAKFLRVTPRTLQNYRDRRMLPFSQIGSKIYYRASDIQKHLEAHYIKSQIRKGGVS